MVEYLQSLAKALESIGIVAAWSMWISLLFGILNTVLIIFVLRKLRKPVSAPAVATSPVENDSQTEDQGKENNTLNIVLLILFGIGILALVVFLGNLR